MARATLHAAVLACFTAAASAGDVGTWDRAAAASSIDYSKFVPDHTASLHASRPSESAVIDSQGRRLQDYAAEFTGLWQPTSVSYDGTHVIISLKAGILVRFDGWYGAGGTVILDIQGDVANYVDHGLLAATYLNGYIWMAYSRETPGIGDGCTDDGAIDGRTLDQIEGCKVNGRLSRVPYDPASGWVTGPQEVIIEGRNNDIVCGQFATHGATSVVVGPDGAIYVAFGDGASFQGPDLGQYGHNPCNDPAAYAGAYRVQDPNRLNGKIVRVDPMTLQYAIFAAGFRNPFRLSVWNDRLWESETGWYTWEEINLIEQGGNYGWPCREGPEIQKDYTVFNHPSCAYVESIGGGVQPWFTYKHPPNTPGNVNSVSALAGFNGRMYFGDFTTAEIYSLDANAGDHQLVLRDCYPVGLFSMPVGLIYIDYSRGIVRSLPGAGVPLASPSTAPVPAFVNIVPQQDSWTPNSAISFLGDSNKSGREGNNFNWKVTLLVCNPGATDDSCRAAVLFDKQDKQTLAITSPNIPGTLELWVRRWRFDGLSNEDTDWQAAQGSTLCKCTGNRELVSPADLGIVATTATPSPGVGAGPSDGGSTAAQDVTKSAGFIGGISAAVGVVVVGGLLAAGFYTGTFNKLGLGRSSGTDIALPRRPANVTSGAAGAGKVSAAGAAAATGGAAAVAGKGAHAGSAAQREGAAGGAAAGSAAAETKEAAGDAGGAVKGGLAARRPSFPSLAPVQTEPSAPAAGTTAAAAAAAPRRTPAQAPGAAGAAAAAVTAGKGTTPTGEKRV